MLNKCSFCSSHISKNSKTIYTTKQRGSINKELSTKENNEGSAKHKSIKNYLPLYLRRKLQYSVSTLENKLKVKDDTKDLLFGDINNFAEDFLRISKTPQINNNYLIFRNEIEANGPSNIEQPVTSLMKSDEMRKHIQSPHSQNSSNCSSPDSLATVREASIRKRVISNLRTSTSSDVSNADLVECDKKFAKTKKFSRRAKNTKKPVAYENKENVPESSKNASKNSYDRDTKSIEDSPYIEREQNIFMAQLTADTSNIPLTSTNTLSKTKTTSLSEVMKLKNMNSAEKQIDHVTTSKLEKELSKKKSVINYSKSKNSSPYAEDNKKRETESYSNRSIVSNTAMTDYHDKDSESPNKILHNTRSDIISAIRELIETKLNVAENNSIGSDISDSETVILRREDICVNSYNDSLSPASIKTVITNEDAYLAESDLEYSVNNSSGTMNKSDVKDNSADMKLPDTDSDLISLKSFASTCTSKFSEYYLADNELDNTPLADTVKISSIQDIFERKDQSIVPVVGGLPMQSFSGFSVSEPIVGDQPDFVNFIDSETGSYAFEQARQATSEEIYVSGRSSDTYESCYVEDDAYVPNWLFHMISQQQSAEESEAEEINMPIQMAEPPFDINGNMMEPVALGAGAGDGRGMHSDHSQDSSGRGTSLSSSEVSSGQQSEAILIDPSTFTAPVGFLRESTVNMSTRTGSNVQSDNLPHIAEDDVGENASNSRNANAGRLTTTAQVVSDFDADVSSLDTDAIDSDD